MMRNKSQTGEKNTAIYRREKIVSREWNLGIHVVSNPRAISDPCFTARFNKRGREKERGERGIGCCRGEDADTMSPIIRPTSSSSCPPARLEQNARICSVFHLSVYARLYCCAITRRRFAPWDINRGERCAYTSVSYLLAAVNFSQD